MHRGRETTTAAGLFGQQVLFDSTQKINVPARLRKA
jgi:hypothetical protein